MEGESGGKGKEILKGIKMCHVRVPTPHQGCKHCALKACTNKEKDPKTCSADIR